MPAAPPELTAYTVHTITETEGEKDAETQTGEYIPSLSLPSLPTYLTLDNLYVDKRSPGIKAVHYL